MRFLIRAVQILRARIACLIDPVAYHRSRGAEIGERVEIAGGDIHTFGSEPYLVRLGDDVTVSNDVRFVTHDGGLRVIRSRYPEAFYYARIEVADNVFIGAGATLLPGATIGRGSVIGAGAVVAGAIPPDTVAVGIPARPVKAVEDYALARRGEWIDTAGLSAEQKRRLILRRLEDRRAPGNEASG